MKKAGGPPTVTCYICGRSFGRSSIGIHTKQCKKLFIQREELKPPNERRKLPTEPKVGMEGETDLNKYNDAAFETFNNETLVPCNVCGRTFLPESLQRHQNACNVDTPARKIGEKVRTGKGLGLQARVDDNTQEVDNNNNNNNNTIGARPISSTSSSSGKRPTSSSGRAKRQSSAKIESARQVLNENNNNLESGKKVLLAVISDLYARGMDKSDIESFVHNCCKNL